MTRLPPGDVRHAAMIGPMPGGLAVLAMATVAPAFIAVAALAVAALAATVGHPPATSWDPSAASRKPSLSACRGTCPSYRPVAAVGPASETMASLSLPGGRALDTMIVAVAPTPTADPNPGPSPTTKPVRPKRTHRIISGVATWHATGRDGAYAAAGPLLREALGRGWRGTRVEVCSGSRCIRVTLNDACWCPKGRRLVDLSDEAFTRLAPLSRGVIAIEIRR